MLQGSSEALLVILCLMIGASIIKAWVSRNKEDIWSPLTFIGLTMVYYIVIPSLSDLSMWGGNIATRQYIFYITAVVFWLSVVISFNFSSPRPFKKWNVLFSSNNVQFISLCLFVIALVCYIPFRGFRTSISSEDVMSVSGRTGLVSYFIDLISLFVGASCLAIIGMKGRGGVIRKSVVVIVIFYFTLVLFIVGGFRYRLVFLLLSLGTIYHLFPNPRRINYALVIPIAIAAYLGFAIMDKARVYGRGIDLETARSISLADASKGAAENASVCSYSIVVTDIYSRDGTRIGLEPIINAVLMPIPRAFLPSKPDAEYLRDAERRAGASGGAAFLVFTEAYISFGILGVILYGLLIGWFSKKIWSNYQNNKESIGAILLLALYNGFCYVWISRGYMAAAFNIFIYYVVMPFWLTSLIRFVFKTKD